MSAVRTYRTEKFIKVDVPRVGVFYRVGQLAALLLVFAQLYLNDGWALAETPGGISNAWDEPGMMLGATNDPTRASRTHYCSNPSYSYASESYQFTTPQCEALLPAELTAKTSSSVFFTTAFLETVTQGWPCAKPNASDHTAACRAGGGQPWSRQSGQCGCVTQRAVYPLLVEEMFLAFEHSFDTSAAMGIRGSSADRAYAKLTGQEQPTVDEDGLWSIVVFDNGTQVRFNPGQVLRLRLTEWLDAANTSLDSLNRAVSPDDGGAHPVLRTSGVNVKINIQYTNLDPVTERAVPGKTSVHATVRVRSEYGTWTGAGVQSIWVQFPTLPRDVPQDFHLVERWRQGINFSFHTSGKIVKADFFYLLSVILSGLVMMKFANTATNLYAFNCLGAESVILRNKRVELTSKKSEFAEIGMKAALAAATYPKFDRFCDGTIEAEDIARAFAGVEGVDWETAFMIARNILADADTGGDADEGPAGLNYVEFMTCLEGDSIDFAAFLKDTKDMYGKMMIEFEKEDAEDAAEDAKKAGKKVAAKKADSKEPTPKQKLKMAREKAKADALARKVREAQVEAEMRATAEAEGKDFDEWLEDKERKEVQTMKEKCKAAYEEELAKIEANRPDDPEKKAKADAKKAKAEAAAAAAAGGGGGETAAADGGGGGGGDDAAAADGGGGGKLEAAAPALGTDLGLDEAGVAERMGKSGTLRVHLVSASGLAAKDKGGTSDPFVNCKLGKKARACKAIQKTLDPQWDATLEFVSKVSLKTVIKNGLLLDVMDEDKGMLDSNDLLGKVTADLSLLSSTNEITFHEAVSSGGVIKFSVVWEEGEAVPDSAAKKAKKEAKAKAKEATTDGPRAEAALEPETTQQL